MNDLRNCVVWLRGHPVTPDSFILTEKYLIQNCRYFCPEIRTPYVESKEQSFVLLIVR